MEWTRLKTLSSTVDVSLHRDPRPNVLKLHRKPYDLVQDACLHDHIVVEWVSRV